MQIATFTQMLLCLVHQWNFLLASICTFTSASTLVVYFHTWLIVCFHPRWIAYPEFLYNMAFGSWLLAYMID